MLFLHLLALTTGVCSAFPHIAPESQKATLAKRYVNLLTPEEQAFVLQPKQQKGRGRKKGKKPEPQISHAPPVFPLYPSTVTNPVTPDSFLLQYAQSAKVRPFWNFTETLWAPCERHRQPIPDPATCKPTCEDVHSHTSLYLFTGCDVEFARVCTFATFVLPDSECPDRVNSFKLRCPNSREDLDKAWYNDDRMIGQPFSNVTAAIEAGTLVLPSECASKPVEPPVSSTTTTTETETATEPTTEPDTATPLPPVDRRDFHLTTAIEAHQLSKRDYQYRRFLDGKSLYRYYNIEAPRQELPKWDEGGATQFHKRPWNCYIREEMVQSELIHLPVSTDLNNTDVTLVELCWYPEGTREEPEERCPGMISAASACPKTDEELIEAIVRDTASKRYLGRASNRRPLTREEAVELLEVAMRREEPPCNPVDPCCIDPSGKVVANRPCYPKVWSDF
ncbi:hypothetical protein BJ508DRAFT_89442 [Ascobolus immersus RN42]|uniref:Uncharacterized protein n=1 Tax=Ascobolus immersus RN42 TaxID=1160509 RepID=A0A3N4I8X5_ASCIM|nr:hypothetical protein BJ508DRAFT_89442 [Ascobolus immersus RN42]